MNLLPKSEQTFVLCTSIKFVWRVVERRSPILLTIFRVKKYHQFTFFQDRMAYQLIYDFLTRNLSSWKMDGYLHFLIFGKWIFTFRSGWPRITKVMVYVYILAMHSLSVYSTLIIWSESYRISNMWMYWATRPFTYRWLFNIG